jgi:hypothetical protein
MPATKKKTPARKKTSKKTIRPAAPKSDAKQDALDIRILRAVAQGKRTPKELKTAMRKDVSARVRALVTDNSLERQDGSLMLTKRGAGRLRFAS